VSNPPIYLSVLADQKWHPEMLRDPFDLDAVILASYNRPRPRRTPMPETEAPTSARSRRGRSPRKTTAARKPAARKSTTTKARGHDA
jgi:hypothetical protein